MEITGHKKAYWKGFTGMSQNFLYLPRIVDELSKNIVLQQHFKYNLSNYNILKPMNAKVVVLTRDIHDVVISIIEHIEKDGTSPIEDEPVMPTFKLLSYENKIEYVIDYIIPWYIGFYVSWYRAKHDGSLDVLFLSYTQVTGNVNEVTKQVLDFYNLDFEYDIDEIKNKKVNFNNGKKGRGKDMLSKEQKNKIEKLTQYYDDVNFEQIGL